MGKTGVQRFTFGEIHLYDGIDFLVAIVGLFALSEVFIFLEQHKTKSNASDAKTIKMGRLICSLSVLKYCVPTMFRSTIIGFLAGILPGAGASLGLLSAYSLENQVVDRDGKTFGKGGPRGVVAPEAGNNAAIKNPDIVWGLIAALFIANFMLLALNIPLVGLFTRVLLIPTRILIPVVAMISFVGIYGISGSTFDLMMMVGFGIMGWVFRKLEIPLVPVILGILLGNEMEVNLRRAMTISDGDWMILVGSPLAIGLWIIAIVGFILPIFMGRRVKKQMEAKRTASGPERDT